MQYSNQSNTRLLKRIHSVLEI